MRRVALKGRVSCVWLLLASVAWGQDQTTPSPQQTQPINATAASTELQTFQQEQRALMQERQALVAQGATPEQMEAWRTQNASRFAAQLQRAQDLAAASAAAAAAKPMPLISEINVPQDASQGMTDFLTTQADLYNRRAQLHNAQTPNTAAVFQQQNATEIAAQAQRAKDLGAQGAQASLPVPPPLVLPPNASSQMQAFLIQRDQLMRSRIAVWNQNVTAAPVVRDAAMAQWQQQNATQLQQMQIQAQNLSSTSTTPN